MKTFIFLHLLSFNTYIYKLVKYVIVVVITSFVYNYCLVQFKLEMDHRTLCSLYV